MSPIMARMHKRWIQPNECKSEFNLRRANISRQNLGYLIWICNFLCMFLLYLRTGIVRKALYVALLVA